MYDRQIKLLIIEPHTAVRRALSIRLQSSTDLILVATAANLTQAQSLITKHQPDVTLLGLDRGNLLAINQLIPSIIKLAQLTAVIILSSYIDEAAKQHLYQAGVYRFLLKHINTPQLINEIKSVATIAHASH